MTIYISYNNQSAYLSSENPQELHDFAKDIGLKRGYFQRDHYEAMGVMIERAVEKRPVVISADSMRLIRANLRKVIDHGVDEYVKRMSEDAENFASIKKNSE